LKTVLVTGAARGNGLAISNELHFNGYQVVGADLRPPEQTSIFSHFFQGDLLHSDLQNKIFEECASFGNHFSLVNNAGITLPNSGTSSLDDWNKTLSVNLTLTYQLLELYSERVLSNQTKFGAVVNIGSLSSHRTFPNNPSYVASKHGVLALTKSYAEKLGRFGIRVNSVSPGYIQTQMTSKSFSNNDRHNLIKSHTMLNRWGTSEEVALGVKFLLGDEASFITGTDLRIDGGWLSKGLIEFNEH
jgi:NAD(P)-dependent dehydrogenase (short-subunit alcohol dehydrogenase family)